MSNIKKQKAKDRAARILWLISLVKKDYKPKKQKLCNLHKQLQKSPQP